MMTFNEVLSRFDVKSRSNGSATALCPAHDDREPSLSVSVADHGGTVLYCHAGCPPDAILDAVGLAWADVQPDDPGWTPTRPLTRRTAARPRLSETRTEPTTIWTPEGVKALRAAQERLSAEPDHPLVEMVAERDGIDREALTHYGCGIMTDEEVKGLNPKWPSMGRAWLTFPYPTGAQLYRRDGDDKDLYSLKGSRTKEAFFGVTRLEGHAALIVAKSPRETMLLSVFEGIDVIGLPGGEKAELSPEQETIIREIAPRYESIRVVMDCDDDEARSTATSFARAVAGAAHPVPVGMVDVTTATGGTHKDLADVWRADGVERMAEILGSAEIVETAQPGSTMIMTKSIRNATQGRFAHTDLGMAERFADTYAGRVRYCHPWKSWLVWDGRRWERDETGAARRLMYDLVRSMQKEGAHIEDDQYREALLKHAVDYQKRAKMEAALAIAENLDGIPVMPDRLDGDAWLLNVENGTIDLRLGKLRPHDPGDLITKLAPVHYDEGATAERFERFVLEIFDGSEGLARYMQRLCGYGATGSVREQIIAVLHGHGSNGKGTLTETLKKILGDYAQSIRPDLLMMKRHSGGASEGEAALHGVRLALTSETGSAGRLDEALVKRLTGADTIRARFLFSNEFEFEPTHKILLATNHRPVIRGTDHAIWRRIHLVPFNVRFDGERKDEELPEKLIAEAPGILNWLVHGCLDWQRNGLQPPDEVASATSSYRAEMDVLAGFIDECCTVHEAFTVGASALYKEYRKWADANGEEVLTQTRFGMQLTERGFERVKSGTVQYRGIGLAAHVSHMHHES